MNRRISAKATAVAAAGMLMVATGMTAASAKVPSQSDTGFAGYQVSKPAAHVKTATATFVVPTITCKKASYSGVGPEVVVDTATNKKTNTFRYAAAAVGAGCINKVAEYETIVVVNDKKEDTFNTPLVAGDKVVLSVAMAKSKTKVDAFDVTAGTHTTHFGPGAVGVSARIGATSLSINSHHAELDPFTKLTATKAEINGKPLATQKPTRLYWVRSAKGHNVVLVATSPISKAKEFSLTFKQS